MARLRRDLAGEAAFRVLNRRVTWPPLFEYDGDYLAFEQVLGAALARDDAPELPRN